MRIMKKIAVAAAAAIMVMALVSCGTSSNNSKNSTNSTSKSGKNTEKAANSQSGKAKNKSGTILVVYFSRTGENYGVGNIKKGNTAIVADMIADQTGADTFEIVPVKAYPTDYDKTTEQAKKEQDDKARPEYKGDVKDWKKYDTVFVGYPIWYGDMPMIVYTFLEKHDWNGKTVIPFDTHAGSGLADTESNLSKTTGVKVQSGLAITGEDAQNSQDSVKSDVSKWLKELGY